MKVFSRSLGEQKLNGVSIPLKLPIHWFNSNAKKTKLNKKSLIFSLLTLIIAGCTSEQPIASEVEAWQDDSGVEGTEIEGIKNDQAMRDDQAINKAGFKTVGSRTTQHNKIADGRVTSAAVIRANQSIARSHPHDISNEVQALEESLRNSYARQAAKRADICPKLLQREFDTNVIRRRNDIMIDNYCDYFIYPQPGQRIKVISNNDKLKLMLIMPTLHDFANGAYSVVSTQKHIIRLTYNGIANRPSSLSYDVEVIVED